MKKIESVKVIKRLGKTPDVSWIGEYTDKPEPWVLDKNDGEYLEILEQNEDYVIPERGREYRFFKPYAGGEKEGSEEYQKYGKKDLEYMEALNRGDKWFIGIWAEAETLTSNNGKEWTRNNISSGGLWGIEGDSSDYHKEIENDELSQLKDLLIEYGFKKREIEKAFKNIEYREE